MDNRITQELPGGRSVSVVPLPNDRYGIDLVRARGDAQVRTSFGLTKEAAEALVLLLALHGVTAPRPPHAIKMEVPKAENPEVLAKIQRGMQQSRDGEVVVRSFAKYVTKKRNKKGKK